MNLIIQNSAYVKWYTFMHPLFRAIPEFIDYYWLISDFEVNCYPDIRLQNDPVIIDGKNLKKIVESKEIQWIWGVLTAFKSEEDLRKKRLSLPYACGNPNFWKDSPKPQADNAAFEIVCWDSSLTLFIGITEHMAQAIKKRYPDVKDLDQENMKRSTK